MNDSALDPVTARPAQLLWDRFVGGIGKTDRYLCDSTATPTWSSEPLTEHVVLGHVLGKKRIGVGQIGLTLFGALDFDGKVREQGGTHVLDPVRVERAWADTRRVVAIFNDLGLPVLVEVSRSGGGWHAWLLCDPAGAPTVEEMRRLLRAVLRLAGLPDDGNEGAGHPGIFPHPPGAKGCGRTPFLPWFGLLRGSSGGLFVDVVSGSALEHQEVVLQEYSPISRGRILSVLETVDAASAKASTTSTAPPTFDVEPCDEGHAYPKVLRLAMKLRNHLPKDEVAPLVFAYAEKYGVTDRHGVDAVQRIVDSAWDKPPLRVLTEYDRLNTRKVEEPFAWASLDVREALGSAPKPLNWIAKGICARGEAVVLTAATGLGKTYITLQIAIDIAVGRPVLGMYEVPGPRRVLWIDEEMGAEMLSDRLTRQSRGCALDSCELELLAANLDIRYQQGLSLGDERQFAVYDRTLREGRYDLVVMDSMVALTTGKENDADDVRKFYNRCIAPYKGGLRTAFWILAHPPKPHKDASADSQKVPRGSGDKINSVDRSFYLERDSEVTNDESFVSKVVLHRGKMRQGGSVTDHVIVIDGPEAQPVRVHSLGAVGGEKATRLVARTEECAQRILEMLGEAPGQRAYQPHLNKKLGALGYDKRNYITPARDLLVMRGAIAILPPVPRAPEGSGYWLQLLAKADD